LQAEACNTDNPSEARILRYTVSKTSKQYRQFQTYVMVPFL